MLSVQSLEGDRFSARQGGDRAHPMRVLLAQRLQGIGRDRRGHARERLAAGCRGG